MEDENVVLVGDVVWIFQDCPKNHQGETPCEHLFNHPEKYLPTFMPADEYNLKKVNLKTR